jgi:hypothetical protein
LDLVPHVVTGSLRRILLKRVVSAQDFLFLHEPECAVDFLTSLLIRFSFSSLVLPPATLFSIPPLPTCSSLKIFFFGIRFPFHARLASALVFSGSLVPRQALPVM